MHGDRHLVRVAPQSIPGVQRVIASSISFDPRPDSETNFIDFFGNLVTTDFLWRLSRPARRAAGGARRRSRTSIRRPTCRPTSPGCSANSRRCGRSTRTRRTISSPPRRASRCRRPITDYARQSVDAHDVGARRGHGLLPLDPPRLRLRQDSTDVEHGAARGLQSEEGRLPGLRARDDRRAARRRHSRPPTSRGSCAPSRPRASRGSRAPTPCTPGCGSGAASMTAGSSSTRPTPCWPAPTTSPSATAATMPTSRRSSACCARPGGHETKQSVDVVRVE